MSTGSRLTRLVQVQDQFVSSRGIRERSAVGFQMWPQLGQKSARSIV
jgi:hypothetical protein